MCPCLFNGKLRVTGARRRVLLFEYRGLFSVDEGAVVPDLRPALPGPRPGRPGLAQFILPQRFFIMIVTPFSVEFQKQIIHMATLMFLLRVIS